MRKFKVGDKVRILNNSDGHGFNVGEIVEVTDAYNQDSLVCKSKEDGRDYYLCYMNVELANQTPTLDNDTMIEKLDGEYCSGRLCGDCIFNGSDCGWGDMTDDELLTAYNLAFGNDQSKVVNNSESTFTLTITPSISTLTDGTITTTIKRYHTDEHNERNAMNELIRRYYMEKNMVNVGDTIRITEQTKTLSTNKELLLHHNIPLATALKWSMYKAPMCGEEFKVVSVLKDLESRDLYCLVENEYDAYIVEMEGIVNVGK